MYNSVPNSISETTAVRLFNSVQANNEVVASNQGQSEIAENKSLESIQSCNEFGNLCRICRWNRNDMQISECPCRCKGSVGFIHMQCLKRWIMHRRNNRCEICNEVFDLPPQKTDVKRMLYMFYTRCMGTILKHVLFSVSLVPLAHVVLQQVLLSMDNINRSPNEELSISEVLMASCALLTSSALFFHYCEFITKRVLLIRNIFRQWWAYGSTSEFPLMELDSEIYDIF